MGAPYIYDISSLRVNDLTFILLTWRKWLAPNNASRQQMGFNSAFKGLIMHNVHINFGDGPILVLKLLIIITSNSSVTSSCH